MYSLLSMTKDVH